MPRWVGLLGSWALLVLGIGLATYAVAAEAITLSEYSKLQRVRMIDQVIKERVGEQLEAVRKEMDASANQTTQLESEVATTSQAAEEMQLSDLVITVSTTENKVYARKSGELVFEAVCSTGKNSTLRQGGRTMVFRTPIGRFKILSKETEPVWVPPDWHFIEEAQGSGMEVVRLDRGENLGGLYVQGNNVMRDGVPLPPGQLIVQGGAVIIPPIGTRQRQYADVLGTHRLNLGDGYALHGTQQVAQLGRSVSHGCIRLHNRDIARLYEIAKVGDQVVIY
ncbi:MAG TPA: L,D-transpeptidase [Thermoanaerobaculia bacterium]|nr:L,D-transpeptidase [Thermoanaerobaculia bacterium]